MPRGRNRRSRSQHHGPTLQGSIHVRRGEPNHLPPNAPNILFVLLDDVGFGLPGTFGGERFHRRESGIDIATAVRSYGQQLRFKAPSDHRRRLQQRAVLRSEQVYARGQQALYASRQCGRALVSNFTPCPMARNTPRSVRKVAISSAKSGLPSTLSVTCRATASGRMSTPSRD